MTLVGRAFALDLTHNLDAFRLPTRINERDYERWDKYHRALVRLAHR